MNRSFEFMLLSLLAILGVLFSSCKKEVNLVPTSNSENSKISEFGESRGQNSRFGWTYYPNPNNTCSYSYSGETKPGWGGTYYGGYMNAIFIEKTSGYYIRLTKENGYTFGSNGTAYIKVGSLYGNYGSNYASFSSNDTYVDVPVSIPLNKNNSSTLGVMNLWPVIILSSGERKFTYPILIWTNPLCNTYTSYNALQGYVDNVQVREVPGGCVAFCKNYYLSVFGKNLNGMGHAYQWPGNASNFGLTYYPNGTTVPEVGEIICWSGGSGTYAGYGHIAIIFEVNDSWVKISQQGRESMAPIGKQIFRSGNTLINSIGSSYTLEGLIRRNY